MNATSATTPATTWPEGGRWRHFVYVTRALTATEFKLRYFGSVLGYLWTLLRPLMLFGVLYVVFTHVVRFGDGVHALPGRAARRDRRVQLLLGGDQRRPRQPRGAREPAAQGVLPARGGADLGLADGGGEPGARRPGGVRVRADRRRDAERRLARFLGTRAGGRGARDGGVACCCRCCTCATATCSRIWEVLLQLLFWGTPIIYTIESVPDSVQELMMLNPLAVAIQQGRHWLVPSPAPTAPARRSAAPCAAARAARDLRRDRAPELCGPSAAPSRGWPRTSEPPRSGVRPVSCGRSTTPPVWRSPWTRKLTKSSRQSAIRCASSWATAGEAV